MSLGRRGFLRTLGFGSLAASACSAPPAARDTAPTQAAPADADGVPAAIRALKPMTTGVTPIADQERLARIEKARTLMTEQKIDAIFFEPGSSLFYYTGVQWGLSERMFGMVLPAKGEIAYVCPKFEEARARELTKFSQFGIRLEDCLYMTEARFFTPQSPGIDRPFA